MEPERLAEAVAPLLAGGAAPADLADRYQGVMLGTAVGNALGLPTESRSREAIAARYPDGVTDIDPAERDRPWDDDLAQTVILAEALLAGDRLDPQDLAARLVRWARENGRGIGDLTRRVIGALASGVPAGEAARRVWEDEGRRAAGNGAVMRCAPVALRWRGDGRLLVEEAVSSAVVTHHDPRCRSSVVAVVVALARALNGLPPDVPAIAEAFAAAGASPVVVEAIREVPGAGLDDFLLDGDAMGYTLKAMQIGLWCLQQDAGFEETLVRVVSAGGDTDTNGAVAGAVLGARLGAAAIPARWVDTIADPERLVTLADRLYMASSP